MTDAIDLRSSTSDWSGGRGEAGIARPPSRPAGEDWPAISIEPRTSAPLEVRDDVRIGDIPVDVVAVLGRTRLPVAQLMTATEGERLHLDTHFGQPVELQVNGRVIGYGEIVADHNDTAIGIRLTSVTIKS
ncbi:FliM/FliN family flagellar motor switch protein [Peteryoungia ipomoeae]|uniref:Flagellar motor switch protein FliN-like C-terminal domain-containing protein n=1 Tax=Peteryoungia ipomoeae TaxID=1210932 RepID=A0A4S8NWR4_9HYPH|nr:FliM/FliN family flagellar motor switch protein [Peteryoungia ipomoeae]THV21355.1 hypothetical protein FAA97_15150 [Peteryoungia ipomoeae]